MKIRISNLICRKAIILDLNTDYVEEIFSILVKAIMKALGWTSPVPYHEFMYMLLAREKLGSMSIGEGIALPYIPVKGDLLMPIIAVGISKKGIKWIEPGTHTVGSLDKKPVHLVVLSLIPHREEQPGLYLRIMARLTRILKGKKVYQPLFQAKTPDDVIKFFIQREKKIKSARIELIKKKTICDKCKRDVKFPISLSLRYEYSKNGRWPRSDSRDILHYELCIDCSRKLRKKILELGWRYEIIE